MIFFKGESGTSKLNIALLTVKTYTVIKMDLEISSQNQILIDVFRQAMNRTRHE